jgi:tetratricopeptide (TPR) repeat protein
LAADESNLMKAMAHNARGVIHWENYLLSQDTARERSAITDGVEQMLQAIGLQPQIALFQSNLGFFYQAQGHQALLDDREEEAEERFEQAMQRFEAAIDADGSYAHVYNGIGDIHYSQGEYDDALENYEQVLEIDPQSAAAYRNIGMVYRIMNPPDYNDALNAFEQAIEISPENPVLYYQIAETYQFYRGYDEEYGSDAFLENMEQAENYYRQALDLNENYVYALTGLGWVFYNRENFAEAENQFSDSLDVKEDQAGAHNGLGWSLYLQEKYEDAPEHFERAVELLPDYPDAYLGLAWTLEALEEFDAAREAYEQVLKLASEGDWRIAEAEEGLQRLDSGEGGLTGDQSTDGPLPLEVPFDDDENEPSNGGENDRIGPDNSALGLRSSNQGTLSPGSQVTASLDTIFEAHDWTFEGQAGQVITLRCTAAPGAETDPRINLLAPDGSWLIADDDGGEGLSSRISDFELPVDGTYTVKVDVFELGEYVLVLESRAMGDDGPTDFPVFPDAQPVAESDPFAQALADAMAQPQEDVHVVDSQVYLVSATTNFDELQTFYQEALPGNGWEAIDSENTTLDEGIEQQLAGWVRNQEGVLVMLFSGAGVEEVHPGNSYLLVAQVEQMLSSEWSF